MGMFTAKKKTNFIFCFMNGAWPAVNPGVIFISCGQECDYRSQRARLMLMIKSHSCKPMKLQYLPLTTEDVELIVELLILKLETV